MHGRENPDSEDNVACTARVTVAGNEIDVCLGQPQDEANASVSYISGTRRALALPKLEYSIRGTLRDNIGPTPTGSINGRVELKKQFTTQFSTRRAFFKDPTKISKIVRKAYETLVAFKERWIVETCFITGVPEVMKISSFMDAYKFADLAKQYSDKVSKTVDEMMTRLDDFVRSEEAFASTELPKGEVSAESRKSVGSLNRREYRFHKGGYGADRQRNEGRSMFNNRDGLVPYRTQTPYQATRDQGF
uniref:Reverse transcriptase domain-containing protein n=1 Tax=Tanacetum cinerariifolium TaxID=118510 RepID=A0A6L2JJS9_TANCI|nr:reverse transcriptase domain-containing protein [Tanacetum cinerariifolium]